MNVLFVCETPLHFGGVGEVVKQLSTRLCERGDKCYIYNSFPAPGELPFPASGAAYGELMHKKQFADVKGYIFNRRIKIKLMHYIKKWGIDVVHCHEVGPPLLSALISTDKPIVVSSHGHIYNKRYDKNRIIRPYLNLLPKIKCFIALNDAMRARVENVFGSKVPISVIPNGVGDGWMSEEIVKPKNIILAAGRFSKDKRMDVCINAYCQSKTREKMPLVIIGSGSEQQGLEALAKKQGLCVEHALPFNGTFNTNTVYLPGYIDGHEKERLFERASVFLHPSEFEAFGIVLIEALAKGSIVLAKDIDTYRSQFLGKPFAIKYLGDNEPVVWGSAIDQAVEEAADTSYIRQSINACSVFLWNRLFEQYINIYQSQLKLSGL